MSIPIKSIATGTCVLTGILSTNLTCAGFLLMGKDFISASAPTVMAAVRENKFYACASFAAIPTTALIIGSMLAYAAYSGAFETKNPNLHKQCYNNPTESLGFLSLSSMRLGGNLLSWLHHPLTQCMLAQHSYTPDKGIIRRMWDAEKTYLMSIYQGAFSPQTAPLFGTLQAVLLASSLLGYLLTSNEEQGQARR